MIRLALLLCLLSGCVGVDRPVPPTPKPDPDGPSTIGRVAMQYEADFRESCVIAAGKLRSGEWKTDREYLNGHKALRKVATDHSGQPFADRQQLEGYPRNAEGEQLPFDPAHMAEWLEMMAREGQP